MVAIDNVAFVTVVTHDHLHFALALRASLTEHHPDKKLFVCVADMASPSSDVECDTITLLSPVQFAIPQWRRFAFQYSPLELSCALKPFILEYVAGLGYNKLVYLDADIQLYSSLDEVFRLLDIYSLLLTPHVTQDFPDDGCKPTLAILRNAGIYNAGFVALRTTATGSRFIRWWKERCYKHCIVDLRGGFHVDQAWLDFVPAMFEGVCIVKNNGWNVGFWNLLHRPIHIDLNGNYRVLDERLSFFHFSGFDPDFPSVLSKYQDRLDLRDYAVVQRMVLAYTCRLDEVGRREYESHGYQFSTLSDGTTIQPKWREAVRLEDMRLAGIDDPFDASANPGLRRALTLAAMDVLEARLDWHQRTAVAIGCLVEKVPGIGWMYKMIRVLCEK